MIIDCRKWHTKEDAARERCIVHVGGQEIRQSYYLDTEAGVVQTYDVFGDGQAHSNRLVLDPDWPGFPTFCGEQSLHYLKNFGTRWCFSDRIGILSRTVRGEVTTIPVP